MKRKRGAVSVQNPIPIDGPVIINPPDAEPKHYWEIHAHAPAVKREGRRPPTWHYSPPSRSSGDEGGESTPLPLPLVSLLRERLAEWRCKGRDGASSVTMTLLDYWHREGRREPLFFAQLEAAETIIFLTEARKDFLQGIDVTQDEAGGEFRRLCCRMATGAGKTTVMAMLAAWSILNKIADRRDKRFSDSVLVVCPNVTIRDRLRELDPKQGDAGIYRTRDLVPPSMLPDLAQGRLLTVNWHVFEPRNMQSGNKVVKAGKREMREERIGIGEKNTTARGKRYMTERSLREKAAVGLLVILAEERDKQGNLKSVVVRSERYVESDAALVRRVLGKELGGGGNILVFNDEAHHAYRPQGGEEEAEFWEEDEDSVRRYCAEATVWIKGLDMVQAARGINFCVDFSATPYFLAKAGKQTNRIFPWTVSSFDLQDAIESGLVKIPQLAVRDSAGGEIPGYFNIWNWILPKLTPAERGGGRSPAKPEAILKHAHMPIKMLAGKWQEEFRRRQQEGERSGDGRPPVFIIVCKTQKLADAVYDWLGEGVSPSATIPAADLPELRNRDGVQNTICVHSEVQNRLDSGQPKGDEEKWMRHTLDTIGKTEWPADRQGAPQYPEGFEALAEKLGRGKHPPGRDVRCIVSVSMLTEGWDCNTVTHIIGLRPFMSQLLCEQVVGRGLRRLSYDVGADKMMSEETASILGVPMTAFTLKGAGGGGEPGGERTRIYAMPGRGHLEIRFPRVEGYAQSVRHRLACDVSAVPAVKVDPGQTPSVVEMAAGVTSNEGRPCLHGPGKISKIDLEAFRKEKRLRERMWEMAASLTRHYVESPGCALPADAAFLQLFPIVEAYVRERVLVSKISKIEDVFLSPYYGFVVERLLEGIRPDAEAGESPELPRYEYRRGMGSSADVDFHTRRTVYPVRKSQVNGVVADTKRLEQQAAFHIDRHADVVAFVKNEGMGFAVPYLHNGERHEYMPDFLIRLAGEGERHLILETKGYDELREVKRAAAERWVAAVNADGRHGRWAYAMVAEGDDVVGAISAAAVAAG